jgi:hypothetical protein
VVRLSGAKSTAPSRPRPAPSPDIRCLLRNPSSVAPWTAQLS